MMQRRAVLASLAGLSLVCSPAAVLAQAAGALDHGYAAWDALLKKHVRWLPDNKQSRVDYKGFLADRAALRPVLTEWSGVTAAALRLTTRDLTGQIKTACTDLKISLNLERPYPGLYDHPGHSSTLDIANAIGLTRPRLRAAMTRICRDVGRPLGWPATIPTTRRC